MKGSIDCGALADYAAMLALAQTQSFESCAPVASITSLVSPDCAAKPDAITGADLAYLQALYRTGPARLPGAAERRDRRPNAKGFR